MKQGTVSLIAGCHSPMHSFLVLRAWRQYHGEWPRLWQVVCIFLHDIGHWGTDYLDSYEQKKHHWKAGASVAQRLFGDRGYLLVAGHSEHSGVGRSDLYYADKLSWMFAPYWWLWTNTVAEPQLRMGYTRREAIERFRDQVKQSIESGVFRETHQFFLDRCSE